MRRCAGRREVGYRKTGRSMRPQSAKAKGRRLQQWAADRYKDVFSHLEGNDVRSLSMGASGDDLILSPAALEVLPYNFEMKNVENFQLWATIRQAEKRSETPELSPCLIVKRNRVEPLAILPFGHFCHLLRLWRCGVTPDGTVPPAPMDAHAGVATLLQQFGLNPEADRLRTACSAAAAFALLGPEHVAAGEHNSLVLMDHWVGNVEPSSRFNFWNKWDELMARQKRHEQIRNETLLSRRSAKPSFSTAPTTAPQSISPCLLKSMWIFCAQDGFTSKEARPLTLCVNLRWGHDRVIKNLHRLI